MGECIEHFSHEHPLSFFQVDADEDPKPHRCSICGLPILSSPSYTCSINANCNFFLHEPCKQLQKEFYHKLHKETLSLEESMLPGESCGNFRYKCWNHSECKFDLHPLVAKPVEIKSQHRSHGAHPLVAFCKEIKSLCNGCGEEKLGFFFHCQVCNFWIHQDCTILPTVVKLTSHPHPFVLAYSLPYMPSHGHSGHDCSICGGGWRLPNGGVYFCCENQSFAHVACAKPILEKVISDTEILHLPDEEDTFPSMTIRKCVERNPEKIEIENKMMSKYHKHPLILEDACSSSDENVVCDVCVKPINMRSYPFYRCHDCSFLAHPICANHLPHSLDFLIRQSRFVALLQSDLSTHLNSVFPCGSCIHPSNGFSYKIENPPGYICLDLECAVAPKIVKHASHKQHILFFTYTEWMDGTCHKLSCCSYAFSKTGIYKCAVCDYSIHIRCALFPKLTRHKFDDHPLELIMIHDNNNNKLQEVFCEVCEQEIELKLWYYGCHKCEHYFHINCIPSVGFHSKVKCGKTHVDNKLHQHPLTLTRMLTHERHERCGLCNQIIKGFSDDQIAFHCSPCYFWLHFSCAAATSGLVDYSERIQQWRK